MAKNEAEAIIESLTGRLRWDENTGRFAASWAPAADGRLLPSLRSDLESAGAQIFGDFVSLSVSGEAAIESLRSTFPFESVAISVRRDDGNYLHIDGALGFLSSAGMVIDVIGGSKVGADRIPARGAMRSVLAAGGIQNLRDNLARARDRNPDLMCVVAFFGARIFQDIFDFELTSSGSILTMTLRDRDLAAGPIASNFDREAIKGGDELSLELAQKSEDSNVLHALALSHDSARRMVAAASPHSAPETLEILVVDESLDVRHVALQNPSLPQRALWKMAHDPHYEPNRVAAAARPDLQVEIVRILVDDASSAVRQSLAKNIGAAWVDISPLADDADDDVAAAALARADLPAEKMRLVAAGRRAGLVLHRDDLPMESVDQAFERNKTHELCMVARRRSLPRELVNRLAAHDSPEVRISVLRNLLSYNDESDQERLIVSFARDPANTIRMELVSMRVSYRSELSSMLGRLAEIQSTDSDYGVRAELAASSEVLSEHILLRLASDRNIDVVRALLRRPETSEKVLEAAAKNEAVSADVGLSASLDRALAIRSVERFANGEVDAASALRSVGVPGKIASRLLADAKEKGSDLSWFVDLAPLSLGLREGPSGQVADVDLINTVNAIATRASESGAMKDALRAVAESGYGTPFGKVLAHIPPQKRLRIIESADGSRPEMIRDTCDMFFGTKRTRQDHEEERSHVDTVLDFVRDATGKEIAGLQAFHDFLMKLSRKLGQPNIRLKPQDLHDVSKFEGAEIMTSEMGALKVVFPKTAHELIDWGETLGICVGGGSYAREAADKKILLVGLRTSNGNKMVGMIELVYPGLRVKQAKTFSNKEIPASVRATLRSIFLSLSRTPPVPKAPKADDGNASGKRPNPSDSKSGAGA